MREFIEPEPDTGHTPQKGDRYIDRKTGVVLTVVAVGQKDGETWVVGESGSGWKTRATLERWVSTNRRIVYR